MTGGALEKYDWRRRLRGGGSGVYTPPCIGRVHDHVHGHVQVVYVYTVVYTDRARPWTRPVYSGVYDRYAAVYEPCTRPLYGRPNGRVRVRPCTAVYTVYTVYTDRVHGRVHGPYTAVDTDRVYRRRCCIRVVYTDVTRTRPCTRPVHVVSCVYGRAQAVYTARVHTAFRRTAVYGRKQQVNN